MCMNAKRWVLIVGLFIAAVSMASSFIVTSADAAPKQRAGKWSCSTTPSPVCGGATCTDEFGNGWCCATKDSDPKSCTLVSQPANQPGRATVPTRPGGPKLFSAPPMPQGGIRQRGVEGEQAPAPETQGSSGATAK